MALGVLVASQPATSYWEPWQSYWIFFVPRGSAEDRPPDSEVMWPSLRRRPDYKHEEVWHKIGLCKSVRCCSDLKLIKPLKI